MENGFLVRKRKLDYPWRLALLDGATLLLVAGVISTVSTSVGGSSTFTLSLILAGAAAEAIRRFSTKVITWPMVTVDVITMALLGTIVSNPLMWGMPFIAVALLTWVVIQGARYLIGRSTSSISAGAQIAITFATIYAIAARGLSENLVTVGSIGLVFWLLAEVAWLVIDQTFFNKLRAIHMIGE